MRPPADAIGTLWLIVGAIALLIFIGVEGALVSTIWRYRASRHPSGEPATFERNRRLEIAWTAAPAVVLATARIATGGGGMPAFAGSVTPSELDDLTTFLLTRK